MSEGDCPRCGEHTMMTPLRVNALSRLTREPDDLSRWICSDCGTDEAFEVLWCKQITPIELWPVESRTFDKMIANQRLAMARYEVNK